LKIVYTTEEAIGELAAQDSHICSSLIITEHQSQTLVPIFSQFTFILKTLPYGKQASNNTNMFGVMTEKYIHEQNNIHLSRPI
jgi:hypothetical protein